MTNVAINGFGRIGRITLRHLIKMKNVKIVAINDLTDIKTLAHLLKYDSSQGGFPGIVTFDSESIIINGKAIKVYSEKDPAQLPWKKLKVDVVIESTGMFRTTEKLGLHLKAGAKKVVISAPADSKEIPTVVKGVNDQILSTSSNILSNASCTTNCAAPLIKIINDAFGISKGALTTVHAYTSDQKLLDTPHKDLRRSRAAAVSIIPTSTGAARAVGDVIPELKGKLEGMAARVPVATGSFTDLTLMIDKKTTAAEINELVKNIAAKELKGIVEYVEDEIVSADVIGNPHSCIFDAALTIVNGNMVKLGAWYDNEYGYSARLAEVSVEFARI